MFLFPSALALFFSKRCPLLKSFRKKLLFYPYSQEEAEVQAKMSIPFSGRLTRGAGVLGYIHKEVASISLKPVKKITFRFDPFREPARPIRDCLYYFSLDKVRNTNLKCIVKTEIVSDNSPPKITAQLENGKSLIFETENLGVEDIVKHFNLIVKPLVPKEEETVRATKGTIAAGGAQKRRR